jgi:rhodanese-related sulfurtransferase
LVVHRYAGLISPATAHAWWTSGRAVLIDVRTQCEWASGRVPGSINVAWPRDSADPTQGFVQALSAAGIARSAVIVLLCRSGTRSHKAAEAAAAAGWVACYNVVGGVIGSSDAPGWIADGLVWAAA